MGFLGWAKGRPIGQGQVCPHPGVTVRGVAIVVWGDEPSRSEIKRKAAGLHAQRTALARNPVKTGTIYAWTGSSALISPVVSGVPGSAPHARLS